MKTFKNYYPLLILVVTAFLTACGAGSESSSTSSTGNKTVGVVTAATNSQITVSGSSFNTGGSTVNSNEIASVADVHPGMVVTVHADDSGNAEEIEYDAEVEGIVDSIGTGVMVVMGQSVDISQNPAFVSEMPAVTDINNIPVGAMVEVSGYSDSMGNIVATYVRLEDHMADENDEMELEGIITALDTTGGTFMIGDQLINYDPASISLTLEDGLNVEVKIAMDTAGSLHATEIEIEDNHSEDGHEGDSVDIQGMVSGELGLDGSFTIDGEMVILGDTVHFEDGLNTDSITDGAILEVEGQLNADGVLVVTEVSTPEMM